MSQVMRSMGRAVINAAGWFGMDRQAAKIGAATGIPGSRSYLDTLDKRATSKRRKSVEFATPDEALGAESRKSIERQRARGGRLSTILSDSDRLGG
jgi:hypothetical protein